MFVNPCFYFEELFSVPAPNEAPGAPDDAARLSDAAPLSPGECNVPETEGTACSH